VKRRAALAAVLPLAALLLGPLAAPGALAQDYPVRTVRLVVPFAPGGGNDALARLISQKLAAGLGQPVIVDNRPGAGGVTGTEHVARAAPDGYTLLLGFVGPLTMSPGMQKVGYDPLTAFEPISLVAQGYQVLAVNPAVPAKSVQELVSLAKSKPGVLNYASGRQGTPLHLVPELFKQAAGVDIVHVPYKGSGPAATAVLAGDAQLMFGSMVATVPQASGGKLRALAVTSPRRVPALPEVPTLVETGFPGVEASSWYGVLAPAGTPRAVVAKLNAEIVKAVASADFRDTLAAQGQEAMSSTPDEFRAFIRAELDKWTRVVRTAGIKLE
jgi:tripartite-type tricarboxylate transporter receptor subunit TctC